MNEDIGKKKEQDNQRKGNLSYKEMHEVTVNSTKGKLKVTLRLCATTD